MQPYVFSTKGFRNVTIIDPHLLPIHVVTTFLKPFSSTPIPPQILNILQQTMNMKKYQSVTEKYQSTPYIFETAKMPM